MHGTLSVDPDHPDRICVWGSKQDRGPMTHLTRPFAFEYDDSTSHWSELNTNRGPFSLACRPAGYRGRSQVFWQYFRPGHSFQFLYSTVFNIGQ